MGDLFVLVVRLLPVDLDSIEVYGPFDSESDAEQYQKDHLSKPYYDSNIVPLHWVNQGE